MGLFFGAGNEARTRYLHLGKVALYQMSYAREHGVYYQIVRYLSSPHFASRQEFLAKPPRVW